MTKNPFLNALGATLYICLVAVTMQYGMDHTGQSKSIIIPIAVLSLFTLSAAVMGFFFILQPLQLYLDGEKKKGVTLFVQTVAAFAGITVFIFLALFYLAPRK